MYFKKGKVMVTKNTTKFPAVTVEADRQVFSVNVDTPFVWDNYNFSIHANGDITLNDNTFSSRETAVASLRAIADFLEKLKK
jgi:hypothetical protein